MITLDTTRADRLGAYAHPNAGTPNLDALATEASDVRARQHRGAVDAPRSFVLFTGRFPPQHGVRDNGGYFLNDSETTLAEVLKARGYATGGFIAGATSSTANGASTRVRHLLRQLRSARRPRLVDERHSAARQRGRR